MQKRRMRVLLGAGLALVGAIIVGALWWMGWPRWGPATVTDRTRVVSLDVPAGWTATTPRDARQIVWPLVGGPYTVADLELRAGAAGSETEMSIYLETAPQAVELQELHDINLGQGTRWREKAVAIASPVRERESLASRNSLSEYVTVRSDLYLVTVFASASDESSLQAANQVIATLKINDAE